MKNQRGFLLLLIIIVITLLLLLVFYFLDFIITETKISQSHYLATKTYYLAEAGINEAIWKLTHDQTWYNNFTSNPSWQSNINRTGVFEENDGYQVMVQNLELARAEITSTAFINLVNQSSQRIIKTTVYQSLTPGFTQGISLYTNDEVYLSGTILNVNYSSVYSYDDVYVYFFSTLDVDEAVMALDNINKSWTSTINAASLSSNNYPPPPEVIEMPQIDFDSADPNSYLNRADQVYTEQEFDSLCDGQSCTLNGITYVTGNINLHRGTNLTINGVLITDGNFKIGVSGGAFWLPLPVLTINETPGQPAGLLSKKSITFGMQLDNSSINGLIYAAEIFKISNLFFPLTINGGVITYKFDNNSLWQTATINLDQEVINNTLGLAATSPIINIEHWEEEY